MNNLCRLTLSQCSLTSKRMISSQIRSHSHFHIPKRTFIRIGGREQPFKITNVQSYAFLLSFLAIFGMWAMAPTTEERHLAAMKKYDIRFDKAPDYTAGSRH